MKTLLVIIDGAADVADASTEGLTPLQAADMPVADTIACRSATGRLTTSPDGNAPGSETAIMSILGYGNDRPISAADGWRLLGLEWRSLLMTPYGGAMWCVPCRQAEL